MNEELTFNSEMALADAGYESSKVDDIVNRGIMKISFIPENQIERLLAESRFTNITRFYSTGLFGGCAGALRLTKT